MTDHEAALRTARQWFCYPDPVERLADLILRLKREVRIETLEWVWNKNADELREEITRLKNTHTL